MIEGKKEEQHERKYGGKRRKNTEEKTDWRKEKGQYERKDFPTFQLDDHGLTDGRMYKISQKVASLRLKT